MNAVIALNDNIILNCVLQCCSGRDQERGDDEDSPEQHQHKVHQEMVCVTVRECRSYSEDLGTRGVEFSRRRFRADLACGMALDAVQMVSEETEERKEIDIKRYAKTDKVSPIVTCATVSVAPTTSVAMVVCRYLVGR